MDVDYGAAVQRALMRYARLDGDPAVRVLTTWVDAERGALCVLHATYRDGIAWFTTARRLRASPGRAGNAVVGDGPVTIYSRDDTDSGPGRAEGRRHRRDETA